MQSNVSGDKLAFFSKCLLEGNRVRYCSLLFGIMIVPMFFVKGIGGGLDMLIISVMMGFMMRNIDPFFKRIFGGQTDAPASVVPFLLPVAMTVGFGAIFDAVIVISCLWNGYFDVWVVFLILVLAARIVVLRTTFPLARMVLDVNYFPPGYVNQGSSGQVVFLPRRPAAAPEVDAVETGSSNAFKPFTGTAHTLNEPAPRD